MKISEAITLERSAFSKTVRSPVDAAKLLRSASSNRKLANGGTVWTKGPFKGMPLYQLTLEERATCPNTCNAFDVCYGNNMPFAVRINPLNAERAFETRLDRELDALEAKYGRFSIRLHVLGDFYSVDYVHFWARQLVKRPGLHIYGYTHRQGDIRKAIDHTYTAHLGRFVILQSDDRSSVRPSAMRDMPNTTDLPICPEQTGKTASCLTCGLCANTKIDGVRFITH